MILGIIFVLIVICSCSAVILHKKSKSVAYCVYSTRIDKISIEKAVINRTNYWLIIVFNNKPTEQKPRNSTSRKQVSQRSQEVGFFSPHPFIYNLCWWFLNIVQAFALSSSCLCGKIRCCFQSSQTLTAKKHTSVHVKHNRHRCNVFKSLKAFYTKYNVIGRFFLVC